MNFFLNLFRKCLKFGILLLNFSGISQVYAGVVLVGTRVILADGQIEKTIYLQNKDAKPYLVQMWLDEGDENSTLDTSKVPFIITPQIFRMEGNTNQAVRLRYTDMDKVSNSQESLYYLNFIQYPSLKVGETDNNRLMVVFKNRLKVFYRPKEVSEFMDSSKVVDKLGLLLDPANKKLTVYNPTPYYANIQEIGLQVDNKYFVLKQNQLVEPKSTARWEVKIPESINTNAKIKATLINDYGAPVVRIESLIF